MKLYSALPQKRHLGYSSQALYLSVYCCLQLHRRCSRRFLSQINTTIHPQNAGLNRGIATKLSLSESVLVWANAHSSTEWRYMQTHKRLREKRLKHLEIVRGQGKWSKGRSVASEWVKRRFSIQLASSDSTFNPSVFFRCLGESSKEHCLLVGGELTSTQDLLLDVHFYRKEHCSSPTHSSKVEEGVPIFGAQMMAA